MAVRNAFQRTSNSVWLRGRISSIWKEGVTWNIPWICIVWGQNLERRYFGRRHIEELENFDASEIYGRRLNAKCIIMPKHGKNFFPVADGTVKLSGGDRVFRKSIRDQPERGEELRDGLRRETDGSSSTDTLTDDREARNDSRSIEGNYIHRHHVEPRVERYVPREESFPMPLRYIDVSRRTHTTWDVLQEGRMDDYWNHAGDRNLSEPWTGFSQLTILDE